jgi:predicted nucleic acid-binding protein
MSRARYFLDTNIIVYSFEASPKGDIARGLVREALHSGIGLISYQVVQEFFNVAFRKFQKPMSTGEAEDYFRTVLRPILSVHSSESLIGSAMRLHSQHQLGWYDSFILAAAMEASCEILYSEDMQHDRRFGTLKVVDPFRS